MGRIDKQSRPIAVDLFSGCGGLTQGLKMAGFDVAGAVEIDDLAAETYEANHPEVRIWRKDIRNVTARFLLKALRLRKGQLGLLAGCPPCQGFSSMRRLNGGRRVRDKDNDLVFDFLRLVKGLRPRAVMMENVPGLAENYRFPRFLAELKRLGYKVNAEIKNARDYGVPQARKRLILLAGRGREIPFSRPARRERTVREAFGQLSDYCARNDELHNLPEARSESVRRRISSVPRNGGSRRALGGRRQLACHKKCDGFGDVYGRMKWDAPSPTITGGCCNPSKGRFLHPTKNRTITLREAALLQTFPVTYYFSVRRGKFPAAQMIGNALPPEFIKRHARAIAAALK